LTKLNVSSLQKLATAGGGTYLTISNDNQDVQALLASQQQSLLSTKAKQTEAVTELWQDQGRWLLLLILPLALLAFRRGFF